MDIVHLTYNEKFINGPVILECLIIPDFKNSKYVYYLKGESPDYAAYEWYDKYIDISIDEMDLFYDCYNKKYFVCPGRVIDKAVSLLRDLSKRMHVNLDIQFYETEVDSDSCTVLYIGLIPF